jgi:membrane-associated phospholipid phosphatase
VVSPGRCLPATLALVLGSATWGEEPGSFASRNARDLAVTGAALTVAGAIHLGLSEPERCRWCEPGPLDVGARRLLLLPEGARPGASTASHLIVAALASAALAERIASASGRDARARDPMLLTEAASLTVASYEVVKHLAARERPNVHYGDPDRPHASRDDLSFLSGHTAVAFAVVASAGTLSSLHEERSAPWVWGVGMTLAAGVGYLRIASDTHYLTDVLAGAAVGTAFGVLVPSLRFSPEREPATGAVAPGRGILISIAF